MCDSGGDTEISILHLLALPTSFCSTIGAP